MKKLPLLAVGSIFLLFSLLTSCLNTGLHPADTTSSVGSTASTPSPTTTVQPTVTILLTHTFISSPFPVLTPTLTAGALCPEIRSMQESRIEFKGSIIFEPFQVEKKSSDLQIFNAMNLSPQDFLNDFSGNLSFFGDYPLSPDHELVVLAHYNYKSDPDFTELVITNATGNPLVRNADQNWVGLYGWVDNRWLMFYPRSGYEDFREDINGSLLLLDPFNQQQKTRKAAFPEVIPSHLNLHPIGWTSAADIAKYSSDLSRAVYYSYNEDNYDRAVVLWDTQTNSELWRRKLKAPAYVYHVSDPEWSPDGNQFIIAILKEGYEDQFELLFVGKDGKETEIAGSSWLKLHVTSGFRWSPNGHFITFTTNEGLLVMDTTTLDIWNPCVEESGAVAWSVDSQQFLLWRDEDALNPVSLIVDVVKREIVRLDFGINNAVWLAPSQ